MSRCRCSELALIVFAALACHGLANAHDYGRVELIRDHWGVPHVFADTDAGPCTVWATPPPKTVRFR